MSEQGRDKIYSGWKNYYLPTTFYSFLTCDIQPTVTLSVKRFTKIKIYYIITAWKCEM